MSTKDDERNNETRVDLGDDLIEKTAVIPSSFHRTTRETAPSPETSTSISDGPPLVDAKDIEEAVRSAEIMISEGFIEEAKKLLRRIILIDPHHVIARSKLDEIHELELKQIFGEGRPQRRQHRPVEDLSRVDSESLMRRLDQDLSLGIFGDQGLESSGPELPSLFRDREGMNEYAHRLDQSLSSCGARDRIDIGIAFFEMGLYELSIRQFRAASRDPEEAFSATALLALALIAAGRPFEATLNLEPIINDAELEPAKKVEFYYLMARAHEGLRKIDTALSWYQRVREIEPYYRDTVDRLRVLSEEPRARGEPGSGR